MAFFPRRLDRAESDALLGRNRQALAAQGWGLYAAEEGATGAFMGFIGLAVPRFQAPFMPAVEIGWRLARPFWGRGLATEGARAVIAHAFGSLAMDGLVSFTTVANQRSRRVMEKAGLTRDPAEDFLHPNLASDHPLAPHVLYRIARGAGKV
jgi:ribosomal-protein-alanine N-acetyltransferase